MVGALYSQSVRGDEITLEPPHAERGRGRFLNKWLRPSGGIVLAHSMSIASASSLSTIPTTAIAWQAT
jgi:hypothetical protein